MWPKKSNMPKSIINEFNNLFIDSFQRNASINTFDNSNNRTGIYSSLIKQYKSRPTIFKKNSDKWIIILDFKKTIK
jgi:hypothetical protein